MVTFLFTTALSVVIIGGAVYGGMHLYKYYLDNIKNHRSRKTYD